MRLAPQKLAMATQSNGHERQRQLEHKLSRVSVMSAITDDGSVSSQSSSWKKYFDNESKSDYYYDEVSYIDSHSTMSLFRETTLSPLFVSLLCR